MEYAKLMKEAFEISKSNRTKSDEKTAEAEKIFSQIKGTKKIAMAFYQFKQEQKVNASIEDVWEFISSPKNLKEITPDYMGFEITSNDLPSKMYSGMIITYLIKPIFGINTPWMTEITQMQDLKFFVDEQRVGPYKLWHHQHHIEPIEGGVLMKDIVTYSPPLGFLGALANNIFIRRKLLEIFEYRTTAINKKFGVYKD
jgi:ligand-binding SRPBCC domain-containing protein